MITAEIVHNVYSIDSGPSTGTAFTININNKQYLITAKHVVSDISKNDEIKIRFSGSFKWEKLDINLVGDSLEYDISVLSPDRILSPKTQIKPNMQIAYGDNAYVIGFPFQVSENFLSNDVKLLLPLPQKVTIASIVNPDEFDPTKGKDVFYLSGGNGGNSGLSGGPVIYRNYGGLSKYFVGGIVTSGISIPKPLYGKDGKDTGLRYKYDTGILVASNISIATSIISKNPIGCPLN